MEDEIKYNIPLKYKEICEIMNDKQKQGGASRERQLTKWNKLYEIEKDKNTYIIKRNRTESEIIEMECNKKYKILIEQALLSYIMSLPNKTTKTLSYGEIYEIVNMVNENYRKIKNQPWKYEDYFSFNYNNKREDEIIQADFYNTINKYYQISGNFLKTHLKDAISDLEITDIDKDNKVFIVHRGYRFFKKVTLYNLNGDKYYRVDKFEATDEEISNMLNEENMALEYSEISKICDKETGEFLRYAKEELNKYYEKSNKYYNYLRMAVHEMGYDGYCKTLKFIWSNKSVELKYNDIMKCKVLLNENVQNGLLGLKLFRDKKLDEEDLKQLIDKTIK